jgi:dTDP-4-amino-4,6-dideoxygalactose transaminase
MIPYGKQHVDRQDKKEVLKALGDTFLTTGPRVKKLEDLIKKKTNSKFALVSNSGTSALHLSFMAIGIKPKDNIIMPAINFIASYNICKTLKANIYLADVDPVQGVMTPETFQECVKKFKIKKIKAIVVMYLGGQPRYNEEFYRIKKKKKCFLIEDACHAFGARYKFKNKIYSVGSCKHSDISTFSFHPVKTFTTGEGGAVTTNNQQFAKKVTELRSHCIIRNTDEYWKYDVNDNGYNFRLSDINCALGISQIKKINSFIQKRSKIANYYIKKFDKLKEFINYSKSDKFQYSNTWHLFIISINFKKLNTTKDVFLKFLRKKKIFCQFHYIPIYRFSIAKRFYKKLKYSEIYFKNAISIPLFYSLKEKDQRMIVKLISQFLVKNIKQTSN